MLQDALILFAVALAGSLAPLLVRRSDRVLHGLVALATGIFLGVVFLDLLPEVGRMAAQEEVVGGHHAQHWPASELARAQGFQADPGSPAQPAGALEDGHAEEPAGGHGHVLWHCVLLGVVALFVVQNVIFGSGGHPHHGEDHHRHVTLGYASFVGLGIHAFTDGLGLAAAQAHAGLAEPVFLSILSHKASEGFSLATVFLLAGFGLRRLLVLNLAFASVTPLTFLLGGWMLGDASASVVAILIALATGTFLYVAIGDLLPEVFHNRVDPLQRLALVAGGVGLSTLLHGVGG